MSATEEKFTAELQASDFKTNISSLEEENKALNGNIDELRNQMNDLQNKLSVPASGSPSFAPSIKSFHATDMTDVSIDADASTNIGMNLTDMSENLGDVVGRQLQEKVERIEELERDKGRLEDEVVETRTAKDGIEKELDSKRELINDMGSNMMTLEGDNKRLLEELNRERVERDIEVKKMKANINNLSETLADERTIFGQNIIELNTQLSLTTTKLHESETALNETRSTVTSRDEELRILSESAAREKTHLEQNLFEVNLRMNEVVEKNRKNRRIRRLVDQFVDWTTKYSINQSTSK